MPSWFYLKLTLLAPASLHKMLPRRSGSWTPICLKLHHALVEAIEFCSFKLNLSKPQAGVGEACVLGDMPDIVSWVLSGLTLCRFFLCTLRVLSLQNTSTLATDMWRPGDLVGSDFLKGQPAPSSGYLWEWDPSVFSSPQLSRDPEI